MKGGVSRARPPGRRHAPAGARPRSRRLPDGGLRIGALVRNADLAHDPDFAATLSGRRRSAAVRRLGAAAQRRDRRRQPAAAHALRLFLRHRQRLQQARARRGLRRAAAARTGCTPCSAGARAASPRTRRTSACRWWRSTPWSRSRAGRPARDPAGRSSTASRRDAPSRETVLEPGELIVAVRLPRERRRLRGPCALPQGPRAHVLRLRGGLGRRGAAASRAARSPRRGIALGGVAAEALARARRRRRCWRAPRRTPPSFRRAAEAALADASPPATTPSRSSSRARIVARALPLAAAGTPERVPALPASPFAPVPGGALTCLRSRSTTDPPHIRHGSNIGQPLTRRDGVLKVTGGAPYAADNHPAGMLHAVAGGQPASRAAASPSLDVAAAKAHPGVVEVMTPANRPPLAQDPGRQDQSLHVPARPPAERPGALRQPADRGGDRRDAGGGDRGRGAAGAALRGRARPRRAR